MRKLHDNHSSKKKKFLQPSKELKDKYPIRDHTQQLVRCIDVREPAKTNNHLELVLIIFSHDNIQNVVL